MIHTLATLNVGQEISRSSQLRSSQASKPNLQERLDLVLQQYQLGIDNTALVNSDLAAVSISWIGQRFEDNLKPSLSRNFGMALDGFE